MCGGMRRKHEMNYYTRTIIPGEEVIPTTGGRVLNPEETVKLGSLTASVVSHKGVYRLLPMVWGLKPAMYPDRRFINARAESLMEKSSFHDLVIDRRCLIIADSFYEQKKGRRIEIFLPERKPMAFAGLFNTWKLSNGKIERTCTVITTEPNSFMKPIHNRMPAILSDRAKSIWLGNDPQAAVNILAPYDGDLETVF